MKENQGSLVNLDLVERFKKSDLRQFYRNCTFCVLIVYATFSPGFFVDNVSLLELIYIGTEQRGERFFKPFPFDIPKEEKVEKGNCYFE